MARVYCWFGSAKPTVLVIQVPYGRVGRFAASGVVRLHEARFACGCSGGFS